MTWLRLQWRGALVALIAWAGLAAAQSAGPQTSPYLPVAQSSGPQVSPYLPAPPPAPRTTAPPLPPINSVANTPRPVPTQATPVAATAGERIVTINENGKRTRCRIVQTWVLQDKSTAYQLQSVDTGEFITILDDASAPRTAAGGLPKRIFHWGVNNRVPPPGVPIPPQLVVESGVVIHREINPPPPGAAIVMTSGAPGATPAPKGVTSVSTPAGAPLPACNSCNACDPCQGMKAAGCGDCLPDPKVIQKGPVVCEPVPTPSLRDKLHSWFSRKPNTTCIAPCTTSSEPPLVAQTPTVAPAPAAPKALPAALPQATGTTLTVPVAQPLAQPQPQAKSLAIVTPPTSAQPAQKEVVTGTPTIGLTRGTAKVEIDTSAGKPFVGAADQSGPTGVAVSKPGNASSTMAAAKPGDESDILTAPEKFMPDANRMKIRGLTTAIANIGKGRNAAAATSAVANPSVTAPSVAAPSVAGLPPGAGSVLAARNGLDGPVVYVPIQPVVVPRPWRAPLPPDPKVPEAPQLNTFVNAFSPPEPPRGQGGPNPMNGFGPMMPYPQGMAYGYGPGMGMPMMPPYAMMNPYMMRQTMPYGPYPMPPMAMDRQRQYQGPLPPDPFHTQAQPMVQPVGYMPPPTAYPQYPTTNAAYTVPAAQAAPAVAAPAPVAQVGQLIEMLRNSPYPAQRELAAGYLASCDVRANPQITPALLEAAKIDPAATVRAGCVTNLMRLNVTTVAYRSVLEELRTDADPRVREAVEAAIVRLGHVAATPRAH